MELITTNFALCNLNPVIYNLTLQGLLTPATIVSKTADHIPVSCISRMGDWYGYQFNLIYPNCYC